LPQGVNCCSLLSRVQQECFSERCMLPEVIV
jgi:hypothetical protein